MYPDVCACVLSQVWFFATQWTVACQAPLYMEFSRQEYWSRLLFLTPGDLPDSGIKTVSLASPILAGRFFTIMTWEGHCDVQWLLLLKDHGKWWEEFRKCQNDRGDSSPYVLPISQSRYHWKPSWLRDGWATRKDPESEWLARDNLETYPITIKRETVSPVADHLSWVPLPCCSPLRQPFPIKSLALSALVSLQTIRFQVLHSSPLSGPGKGLPSYNIYTHR